MRAFDCGERERELDGGMTEGDRVRKGAAKRPSCRYQHTISVASRQALPRENPGTRLPYLLDQKSRLLFISWRNLRGYCSRVAISQKQRLCTSVLSPCHSYNITVHAQKHKWLKVGGAAASIQERLLFLPALLEIRR